MDIVSFEAAKKLKEKGFREKVEHFYDRFGYDWRCLEPSNMNYIENCSAPTISQVFMWLRKEKKIFVAINISYCYEPFLTNPKMEPILKGYYYGIWELDNLNNKNALSEYFETPELAALAVVNYIIDNNLI